jgi:hypothetical protein
MLGLQRFRLIRWREPQAWVPPWWLMCSKGHQSPWIQMCSETLLSPTFSARAGSSPSCPFHISVPLKNFQVFGGPLCKYIDAIVIDFILPSLQRLSAKVAVLLSVLLLVMVPGSVRIHPTINPLETQFLPMLGCHTLDLIRRLHFFLKLLLLVILLLYRVHYDIYKSSYIIA